ncbi:MAG: DUF4381 family protein [Chthoniobacterales bacterium]|jgi:hypothetical protein|nr:DUF4381 family protein [Chthoniobacterales bacterium]
MPPTNTPPIPQDLLPHEIAGPVGYLPYPLPVMIGAAVVLAVLLAVLLWCVIAWVRRRNRAPLTAREKALAALSAARAGAEQAAPYLFSIEVCDVLRNFLSAEHHLPAATQTSYEFLQTARRSGVFDEVRFGHLTRFLEKADAIKFARAEASSADNLDLVSLAEDLVKGGQDAVAA